jgi:hypothetical protein
MLILVGLHERHFSEPQVSSENGHSMFLRNTGICLQVCTALLPRRHTTMLSYRLLSLKIGYTNPSITGVSFSGEGATVIISVMAAEGTEGNIQRPQQIKYQPTSDSQAQLISLRHPVFPLFATATSIMNGQDKTHRPDDGGSTHL